MTETTQGYGEDRYYVCGRCAHTWASPEPPSECEHCHAPGATGPFGTLADAEEESQRLVDASLEAGN